MDPKSSRKQPRKNEMSEDVDPYSFEEYPRKFEVDIGGQKHNARQLRKHAKRIGHYQNMYRQPLSNAQVQEIQKKTGYVSHRGELMSKSRAGQLRKHLKRELLYRQNKPFVGGPTFISGQAYKLDFYFIEEGKIFHNDDLFVFVRYTADGTEFRDPNGLLTSFGLHHRVMATAENYNTDRIKPCTADDFVKGHIENPRMPRCVRYIPANELHEFQSNEPTLHGANETPRSGTVIRRLFGTRSGTVARRLFGTPATTSTPRSPVARRLFGPTPSSPTPSRSTPSSSTPSRSTPSPTPIRRLWDSFQGGVQSGWALRRSPWA
jgi:hypothetical protein